MDLYRIAESSFGIVTPGLLTNDGIVRNNRAVVEYLHLEVNTAQTFDPGKSGKK